MDTRIALLLIGIGLLTLLAGLWMAFAGGASQSGKGKLPHVEVEGPAWLVLAVAGLCLVAFGAINIPDDEIIDHVTTVEQPRDEEAPASASDDPVSSDDSTSGATTDAPSVDTSETTKVSNPAPSSDVVVASCSSDKGPELTVGEQFTLIAQFEPADAPVTYTWSHGDGTEHGAEITTGLYRYADQFDVTMHWQAGDQTGVETCAVFNVRGVISGWRVCQAGNEPDPTLTYTISESIDDEGLNVRAGPGTESDRLDALQRGSAHQFIDCLQRSPGSTYWWQHSSKGWASANFIDGA